MSEGDYKEGVVRSQRDLFSVYVDRPADMPDFRSGQTRLASVTRRAEPTLPTDGRKNHLRRLDQSICYVS